jgi:hypothetical protein
MLLKYVVSFLRIKEADGLMDKIFPLHFMFFAQKNIQKGKSMNSFILLLTNKECIFH